jgi:hypothetical protein
VKRKAREGVMAMAAHARLLHIVAVSREGLGWSMRCPDKERLPFVVPSSNREAEARVTNS